MKVRFGICMMACMLLMSLAGCGKKEEKTEKAKEEWSEYAIEIESVVNVMGRGTAATGKIISGDIRINDMVEIQTSKGTLDSTITWIFVMPSLNLSEEEVEDGFMGMTSDDAKEGDCVAVLLRSVKDNEIKQGDKIRVLTGERTVVPENEKPLIESSVEEEAVSRETVLFGNYQGEAIEWLVLDTKEDKQLLLSKEVLDVKKFNEEEGETTWEDCSLRAWLNSEFLDQAFSEDERARIRKTINFNAGYNNLQGKFIGGNDTEDMVFLLSNEEAEKYFLSDSDRATTVSLYVLGQTLESLNFYWWLRTAESGIGGTARVVYGDGQILQGLNVDKEATVRPAMWVSLE